MINLWEAHKAGLFGRSHWLPNIIAGVIVGVVALPLAMAFAIASGARPEQGIYTSIVAGFVVSALGGSRTQIAGPTGAFIVILSAITLKYGIDGLQIATMMAGVILLLMGWTKMGGVIKFIPAPVIVGFTAGIGVVIWVGQWKYFFGLTPVPAQHFHETLWHLLEAFPGLHWATTALGGVSLLLMLVAPKITGLKKVPAPLVALVGAGAVQALFGFDGIATIGSAFGGIPQTLPSFAMPSLTLSRMIELIGPAFTIAMLGSIESLLSAVVADGMAGTRHNSNQELIGQGVANIVAPLFGGFAATGAIARTATNIRNGGTSPLAGITHAVTLLLVIVLLAPLAADVPLAVLAAILFVVAYNMCEIPHFLRMLRRAPRADVAILLITFVLTVFTDLVVAVNIGVILAILHFIRRMATSFEVQAQSGAELAPELTYQGLPPLPPEVLVYAIEGPFFFGAVETFESALLHTHTEPKILLLRLRRVPFIDITGIQMLEEVMQKMQKRGVHVLMCEANARVKGKLQKAGILDALERDAYHDDFAAAIARCNALARLASTAPND